MDTKTDGGRYLARWIDCYDPEDSRFTHRLRAAQTIVRATIGEPEYDHSDRTEVEFGRPKHVCNYRCTVTWPAWVTGEMFDAAFRYADLFQTARGDFHRAEAAAGR